MFGIFYNLFLGIYFLISLPIYLLNFKKYRFTIMVRFFFNKKNINTYKGKDVIWIHAVSLGEIKVASILAKKIKDNNKNLVLIISSTTKTGYNQAKKSISFADCHLFLPLDFSWIMKKLMKIFSPKHVILVETDFWYNFLNQAKKNGATISLVNGKVSDRSYKRYKIFKWFTSKLLSLFDIITVQDEKYKSKFIDLKIPKQKIHVIKNLKLEIKPDVISVKELDIWKKAFKINNEDKVITIASTHHPEEKLFLNAIPEGYKYLLAPRHPERFKAVKAMLEKAEVDFGMYSQIEKLSGSEKVILIDVMGKLNLCYQLSDLAIVGGSFTSKIGGHNILEPIFVNTPVFFGKNMCSQLDLKKISLESICAKEATIATLQSDISSYFEKHIFTMKENCSKFNESSLGLIEDTYRILEKHL